VIVSIISVGNELLNGDTLNSNAACLGQRLADLGLAVHHETCVPDDHAAIADALLTALATSTVVLTIGGLGPTRDDLTRTAVAQALGRALHDNPAVADGIRDYLQRRGVAIPAEAVRLQALVPEGASVLPNPNGTAPGLWCDLDAGRAVVLLPGPPSEFIPMVDDQVVPRLRARLPAALAAPRVVRVAGVAESNVEATTLAALRDLPPLGLAYCAKPGCVTVRLTDPLHPDLLNQAEQRLRQAFQSHALPADCASPAEHVGRILRQRGLHLATAESCTGGLVAAAVTDLPGSSEWFTGAVVAYANDWKERFLDVDADLLRRHGAVSEPVVRAMLDSLTRRYHADAAVAVSGVAGPGGGTPDKPVGTVFLGVAVPGHSKVIRLDLPGSRHSVRERTVAIAFVSLREALLTHPPTPAARTA